MKLNSHNQANCSITEFSITASTILFINSQLLPYVALFKERGYHYVCIHITSISRYLCLDSKYKEVHLRVLGIKIQWQLSTG